MFITDKFQELLNEIGKDDRKAFVNDLFETLTVNGAETIDQLFGSSFIYDFLKSYVSADPNEKKKVLMDLPRTALNETKKQWDGFLEKLRRDTEQFVSRLPDIEQKKEP